MTEAGTVPVPREMRVQCPRLGERPLAYLFPTPWRRGLGRAKDSQAPGKGPGRVDQTRHQHRLVLPRGMTFSPKESPTLSVCSSLTALSQLEPPHDLCPGLLAPSWHCSSLSSDCKPAPARTPPQCSSAWLLGPS